MLAKYRYPGTRPYLEKDRNLFFGRERDIEKFSRLVVLEKLVVLIGRSGYGKTSLLNAGVIPRLIEKEKYVVFPIELKEKTRDPLEEKTKEPRRNWSRKPLDLLLEHLKKRTNDKTFLTDKFNIAEELPKDSTALLWYYIKVIQIMYEGVDAITLVFDHFEDLFDSYPHEVDAFSEALATVLNLKSPKSVRNLLKQKINAAENNFKDDEIRQILEPLNLKVVFSLRNDYLGELHRLKKFIPGVYSYTYELLPLNQRQALEALEKPASLDGDYSVPPFKFSQQALEDVIQSFKESPNKRIEAFQLQLIGEHAEEIISSRKKADTGTAQLEISSKELGSLDKIWQAHYDKIISEISPNPWKQRKVKRFIENHLISSEGTRIPVDEVTATTMVSKEDLDSLEESLLIRRVLNSVSTTSYEISHDTLVAPILKSAEKRRKNEFWLVIIVLAILAIILGYLYGRELLKEKENPEHEETIESLEKTIDSLNRLPTVIIVDPPPNLPLPDSLIRSEPLVFKFSYEPCKPNSQGSVNIEVSNGIGAYNYVVLRPDGTKLNLQEGNTFYGLSEPGKYSIIVKDSNGSEAKQSFEVKSGNNCHDIIHVDPEGIITTMDSVTASVTAPEEIDICIICPPPRRDLEKIFKFNKGENHLVGIGIKDSKENPKIKKILLILLFDKKAFWFNGAMSFENAKFFNLKQIKYSLKSPWFGKESKYRLRLEDDYYLNSDGDTIPYREDDEEERYRVFGELIKKHKIKNVDDIYYSYIDGTEFNTILADTAKSNKYNYIRTILRKQ